MSNDIYIREKSCLYEDNGIMEVFFRSSRNYRLYKLLKHKLSDEYKRITTFHRGFSRIEYRYSNAEMILLNEYFLWLNHNDLEELEILLKTYADCLAERLVYSDDIFIYEHDNDPCHKVNTGNIEEKTKELVERLLRPSLIKRKREINSSNTGIYNSFTGETVRPNDGTYYIDDFR